MMWYLFNQLYSGKNYIQLFQKCECAQVGPSSANIYKKGGGGSKKRAILWEPNNWMTPYGYISPKRITMTPKTWFSKYTLAFIHYI